MDDKALVSRIIDGDKLAFQTLIRRNEKLVVHMIGRLVDSAEDREEICQDVFMRVYEKIGDFNFQSQLSTWVATIAYRYAINHLRKKKILLSEIPQDETFANHFVSDDQADKLADQDMEEYVLKLVDQLPPQYKVVLTLYHLDHKNYAEIEEITGMPEGTVKNYLFRARHLLKEKVKKYLGTEEWI